jgi:hypothetical protein
MELFNGDQLHALKPRGVVSDDKKQGIFIVGFFFREFEKVAERVVSVLHGVITSIFGRLIKCDSAIREFKWDMIGSG